MRKITIFPTAEQYLLFYQWAQYARCTFTIAFLLPEHLRRSVTVSKYLAMVSGRMIITNDRQTVFYSLHLFLLVRFAVEFLEIFQRLNSTPNGVTINERRDKVADGGNHE